MQTFHFLTSWIAGLLKTRSMVTQWNWKASLYCEGFMSGSGIFQLWRNVWKLGLSQFCKHAWLCTWKVNMIASNDMYRNIGRIFDSMLCSLKLVQMNKETLCHVANCHLCENYVGGGALIVKGDAYQICTFPLHPAFNPALPFFSPKLARDFRQKIDQIKLHTIGQQ